MSVLDDIFWWLHIVPDEDSAPTGTLTSRQATYVMARSDGKCVRRQPGCGDTATHIELAEPKKSLQRLHKHPDTPDAWVASCANCTQFEPTLGELPTIPELLNATWRFCQILWGQGS